MDDRASFEENREREREREREIEPEKKLIREARGKEKE
jgi:hypothetical protein